MKKVGIVSMQRIINYGSFLQAYALKSTIEELGNNVQFVDYRVERCIVQNDKKRICMLAKYINKFKRLIWYISVYPKMGNIKAKDLRAKYLEYLKMLGIDNSKNYTPQLDTLVIGSDEVFNCLQDNPDVGYSKELFGYNNKADKVITYAASFGTTTLKKLEEYNILGDIRDMLLKINSISIRDDNSGNIVTQLTKREPIYNLDPVFIYNFDRLIDESVVKVKDYILVYFYENRISEEEGKELKEFAKKYNKKLLTVGIYQKCCDIMIKANPFELLAYVKKADYVITDTFHGTVFSIKYNKKFATIIRKGNKQKLTDLISRFNLTSMIVNKMNQLESVIFDDINYIEVNEFIEKQKDKSIEYLKNNL